MKEPSTHRALLRRLADRLIDEYAGILPPGQVLAAVFRVNHTLDRTDGLTGESRLVICESFVRQVLSHRVGETTTHSRPAPSGWAATAALAS